jgi:Predicted nucleic acid-binding protein, contains PIN domain
MTFVSVAELLQWPEIRSWGDPRRRRLEAWLAGIPVLPYDPNVARTWAGLSARAQRRGRPRPINDTWVAACCPSANLPLVTLNRQHFEDFERHEGLVLLP